VQPAELLAWLVLRAAADRAELATAQQDIAARNQARLDGDRIGQTVAGPAWLASEPTSRAQAFRALIKAEQLRLAGQPDPECWALSSRYSRSCHRPHLAAYAAWRQAEALLAQRAPRQATADSLRRAHSTANRIGATPLRHELQTLARYARIELHRPVSDGPANNVPAGLQTLTSREREILDQLAAGLTNKQIAERLYISPRTAAVHVSNILHKLGVPDRVQAAHLARKIRGL
jgi:DNA-binding CsgD family transcriptional regulator